MAETGERPPAAARLVDVARRAGVGRSSAAKVLLGTGGRNTRVSPAMAERIRAAAHELEYRPNLIARQLKGIRSQTLGLVIHHSAGLLAQRIFSLEHEAWQRGYRLIIGHGHGDPDRIGQYLSDFAARAVDAIIAVDFSPDSVSAMADFDTGRPVVFQGTIRVERPNSVTVQLDRAAGVEQAVGHLLQRGRRRIAIALPGLPAPNMMDRLRGYRDAMTRHGLAVDEQLIWAGRDFEPMIEELLARRNPDAIIMPSDVWAVELLKRQTSLGLVVPRDLSVVGFDNRDIASATVPELTTVDQEIPAMAAATMDAALRLLHGEDVPSEQRHILIQPRLVVRGSS